MSSTVRWATSNVPRLCSALTRNGYVTVTMIAVTTVTKTHSYVVCDCYATTPSVFLICLSFSLSVDFMLKSTDALPSVSAVSSHQ